MIPNLPLWSDQIARREDPTTSHEAAHHLVMTGRAGRMTQLAVATVKAYPGRTAKELESLADLDDGQIRKRLNDARNLGLITIGPSRKCRISGRRAQTWRS